MPEYVTIQIPVSLVSAIQVLAAEIGRLAGNNNNNNLPPVVIEETEADTGGPTGTEEKPYDEQEVKRFCKEKGLSIDSHKFYVYYQARGWKSKGGFTFNWKEKAMEWQSFERPKPAKATFSANATVVERTSGGDDLEHLARMLGMEWDENNHLVKPDNGEREVDVEDSNTRYTQN